MKNDYHVLNWGQITKNTDDTNKGIIFEDLIEKLIKVMFPYETWMRTKKSYDGKRDFVYPADEYLPDEKWAECKNYSDSLSINVIAPTLIMGALDNIEYIYVFSYSKLNNNSIDSILRYSKTSRRKVKIFDGDLLEKLICKYHNLNGIGDFFKNTDFNKAEKALNNRLVNVIYALKNSMGNHINSDHEFQAGESFCVSTIVQNLSLNTIECNVEFSVEDNSILTTNAPNIVDYLEFGTIKEYKIYCSTIKSCNSKIFVNTKTKSNNTPYKTKKFCRKIKVAEEPYLFLTGESAVNSLNIITNHLLNYNNVPIIMSSKSGAGKSTIIDTVLQHKQIQERYTIINISIDYLRDHNVKNIFYQIIKVQNEIDISNEQHEDSTNVLSVFLNNYAKSAGEIAKNIMNLYIYNKPYLFIIDDIQKINRSYIDILYELNRLSTSENKPIYYLFSLNLDVLSFEDLLIRLNWDVNYRNVAYKHIKINYFDKKDIINFYKHKYGITDIDNCFSEFEHEISPLELQSFTTGLKTKGIISYNPITLEYYVTDKIAFEENITKILYLRLAVDSLCFAYENSGIPQYLLKNLYLNDELSILEWSNYKNVIHELINNKIIKEDNGNLIFTHDKIRDSVKKKLSFIIDDYVDIFYNEQSNQVAKLICAINGIDFIFHAPLFIKDFFNKNNIIKSNQLLDLCICIFEKLHKFKKYNLTASALSFVCDNLKVLRSELPQMEYYKFMCFIINIIKTTEWAINEKCVESISYLIKKYFDRKLSTNNYDDCYDEFKTINRIYNEISNISDDRKHYWLSHFSNRTAVALDKTSNPFLEEPKLIDDLYKLSEYYCKQANNDVDLLLQISVDNFYRSYSYRHNLTIDVVKNCSKELVKLNIKSIDRRICLDYHLLLLKYLEMIIDCSNNKIESEKFLKSSKDLRKQSKSAFYNIKLYLLEIYILIDLGNLIEANKILEEALEFAYKKGMRTIIYKFTYIKAFLLNLNDFISEKDYQKIIILAFEQFMDTKGLNKNKINHEIFLVFELLRSINSFSPNYILKYVQKCSDDISELLLNVNDSILHNKDMQIIRSSFNYYGVDFPLI